MFGDSRSIDRRSPEGGSSVTSNRQSSLYMDESHDNSNGQQYKRSHQNEDVEHEYVIEDLEKGMALYSWRIYPLDGAYT